MQKWEYQEREQNDCNAVQQPNADGIKGLAMIRTRAAVGVQAKPVIVEVHLANGLPAFNTVGLPETAVRESKDRVRGALINSGFEFPAKRITVNLAPADLPKSGSRFDLPIALGILIASGQLMVDDCSMYEFVGELALDGSVRKVPGILPSVLACGQDNTELVLPTENADEAGLFSQATCWSAAHLLDVCSHILGQNRLHKVQPTHVSQSMQCDVDMGEVYGQAQAKRALEIAAAGGHSMLMLGPPGTGKSMLAQCLPGIMPLLGEKQALQVAAMHSVAMGEFDASLWKQRPFRAPHHSASAVALVGGGANAKPGEISLAHQGVLFLDELTEFSRSALEQLREPLETGSVHIARANASHKYPAEFQLIVACNPCPCGFYGDSSNRCKCSAHRIQRYQEKLSGPMMDRIDMHLHLQRVPLTQLQQTVEHSDSSQVIRQRVEATQLRQNTRQGMPNSRLTLAQLDQFCRLQHEDREFLSKVCDRLHLSARSYHRLVKLARTIADLDAAVDIQRSHLSEAVSLRALDRMRPS